MPKLFPHTQPYDLDRLMRAMCGWIYEEKVVAELFKAKFLLVANAIAGHGAYHFEVVEKEGRFIIVPKA